MAKLDQAGPKRAKHLPNRVKQGHSRIKRLKWGVKVENIGNRGFNWDKCHEAKQSKMWSNMVKPGQTGFNWVGIKWGKIGTSRLNWVTILGVMGDHPLVGG